jgi:S-adenosylmethionine synthetase
MVVGLDESFMPDDANALVVVSPPLGAHPDAREVEMVERKGRGHPDSICDALAEAFGIGLSRFYYERCGRILHHNVDKVLLAAGSSTPRFGGGEVIAPCEIYLAGRATQEVDGTVVPIADIANETSRVWLRANLHAVDVEHHARIHTVVRAGSPVLSALVAREGAQRARANDTSFAVGYAPLSRLEQIVLAVEQALTAPSTVGSHPMLGEDVKVMGVRRGQHIDLTVACAIVDRYVHALSDYVDVKDTIARLAERAAHVYDSHVAVAVNTADDLAAQRIYLTVTGISAESGDDGQTGRGNRVGGLITPCRPMTLEAAAGKNVVSHVGKSYSIVAHRIANELVTTIPDIAAATCVLVSRIGQPVDVPQAVELQIQTRNGAALDVVRRPAEAVARTCLREITELGPLLLEHASIESPAVWPGVRLF